MTLDILVIETNEMVNADLVNEYDIIVVRGQNSTKVIISGVKLAEEIFSILGWQYTKHPTLGLPTFFVKSNAKSVCEDLEEAFDIAEIIESETAAIAA
jgi:hypothetical protein